jgi:hypothetical protein
MSFGTGSGLSVFGHEIPQRKFVNCEQFVEKPCPLVWQPTVANMEAVGCTFTIPAICF